MVYKFVLDRLLKYLRNNYTVDVSLSLAWIDYFIDKKLRDPTDETILLMVNCKDCNIVEKMNPIQARSFMIEHFEDKHQVSSYKVTSKNKRKSRKTWPPKHKAEYRTVEEWKDKNQVRDFYSWEAKMNIDNEKPNKSVLRLSESKLEAEQWRESYPSKVITIRRPVAKDTDGLPN